MPAIAEQAPSLWKYLNGNGQHLKLMATIADDTGLQWAVFFGIKGPKPNGDADFTGTIDGAALKPSWKAECPLWLVPLTLEARTLALTAKAGNGLPDIVCNGITACNASIATAGWNQYKFWNESATDGDVSIALAQYSRLQSLDKGRWLALRMGSDMEWPVWLTTEPFAKPDRLIVFPAPACHIIDKDGKYRAFELWLGVVQSVQQPPVRKPFISVDRQARNPVMDGDAAALYWRPQGRTDDVFIPLTPGMLHAKMWTAECPIKPFFGNGAAAPLKQIVDVLKGNDQCQQHPGRSCLFAWMVRETAADANRLSIFFVRRYDAAGRLEQLIGNTSINVLQVCRPAGNKLLVRVGSFRRASKDNFTELWNRITQQTCDGLLFTSGSAPVGIVPVIAAAPRENQSYVAEWQAAGERPCPQQPDNSYSLTGSAIFKGAAAGSIACHIELPLLRDERYIAYQTPPKQPIISRIVLRDATLASPDNFNAVQDNGTLYQVFLQRYTPFLDNGSATGGGRIVLRDGAMAFTLAAALPTIELPASKYGRLRLTLQLQRMQRPLFLWQWHGGIDSQDSIIVSYAVEDFSLPVSDVEAAGQDLLNSERLLAPQGLGTAAEGFGERSEPALVIPLPAGDASRSGAARYFYTLSESVNVGQDHRLDVRLQQFNEQAGVDNTATIKAVVLDANPQLTALVDAAFLQQPGFDDGAWVLARRSPFSIAAGGWEILDDNAATEGFSLVLPSQAIGEAYVKGNGKDTKPVPGEPEDHKSIQYRFGAPAVLKVSPARLDRRYVAPPWNLRHVWGQPGDAAPGVPFRGASFELTYAMLCNLFPENAFIAELAARLGDAPVPPINSMAWEATMAQQKAFRDAWTNYLAYYRAWKSRLAVLEPSAGDDFANATFKDNIGFNLRVELTPNNEDDAGAGKPKQFRGRFVRKGADIRYPVDLGMDTPDQLPLDNLAPDAVNENRIKALHTKDGLAGGAVYGFESAGIYREFLREVLARGSSSGEVKGLAFTSLGGYGRQTARFASDKTVIKSDTNLGRTHFYAVERIGRIGVFWNKAKHVIEYERTVVPSKQFKEFQPPLPGRPLVRKVREYVEILEPVRNYPDFAGDAPDAPGSVTSCTFKSIIIPVLSSWGHDVFGNDKQADGTVAYKTIGWEVPLWKPGADAAVYPKPQVMLSLLPPPDADGQPVMMNMSEPQHLWFYTDTREFVMSAEQKKIMITADVHAWPAVQHVDFPNLPDPEQYDIAPAAGDSPEALQAPMPDVLDVLPGFERYTFRVDRQEMPAAVAERYYPGAAIAGRLRTVSMKRSVHKKEAAKGWWAIGEEDLRKSKDALKALVDGNGSLLALAANGFHELENDIRHRNAVPALDEYVEAVTKKLADSKAGVALKAIVSNNIQRPELKYFKNLWAHEKDLHYPVKWLWREALQAADGAVNRMMNAYDRQVEVFIKALSGANIDTTQAQQLLQTLEGRLQELQVDMSLTADALYSTILAAIDQATDQLSKAVEEGFGQFTALLDKTDPSPKVEDIRKQLAEALARYVVLLQKRVDKVFFNLSQIDNSAWKDAVDSVCKAVDNAIAGGKKHIETIIAQEHADARQYLRSVRENACKIVSAAKSDIAGRLAGLRANSRMLAEKAREQFGKANENLTGLSEKIFELAQAALKAIKEDWEKEKRIVISKATAELAQAQTAILNTLQGRLCAALYQPGWNIDSVFDILQQISSVIGSLENIIKSSLINVFGAEELKKEIENWLNTLPEFQSLAEAIKSNNIESVLKESVALANAAGKEFGRLTGEVAQRIRDIDKTVNTADALLQTGKQTLTNFCSVWEEFTAPGMGLNRRTVALIVQTDWTDIEQRLSLTPCIARVKQFGDQLEGLGLRLPVAAITNRLLPARAEWGKMQKSLMSKFDFSNLLSDLGGMRFDKLFPGLKMPEFARDKVSITHGFDRQQLSAWVNAEANVQLAGRKKLMNIGPVLVELENGSFKGRMRLETDIEGKTKKTNSGELSGSWHITIAGTGLMIFRDTRVIFKDGKLTFDLDPKRMQMPGLLKMLTDATTRLSATGAGGGSSAEGGKAEVFKVGLIKVHDIPAGVRAQLNLPPLSVGGGTTAITNLSFGGHFELRALTPDLKFKFMVALGFYLGKKEAPFNVTIFILGGGGYIDFAMTYVPKEGLTIDVVMSVHASVSLAVALGWMTGMIVVMAGFEGEYHKTPRRGSSVYITIFVRVIGVVDILGLITVSLFLGLEATYRSLSGGGNQLVGTGIVSLQIRICRFVKIKVRKSYSKTFAGKSNSSDKAALAAGMNAVLTELERAQKMLQSLA